ncbi:GNAT family N-acetyltransferase [Kineococcus sp. SYSU DK001]|uniref:GNAT family N-acetyltransferase n=1 Tax=Kineococcus sp. SYSU DK001 TaxID=3383122 RepID=UPI003D7E63E9
MTTGSAELVVRVAAPSDPLARPLFADLAREYGTRYGGTPEEVRAELERYPASEFAAPHGVLLLLLGDGAAVAGGAYRRYDPRTAELKRIWTHPAHRRRGLARRVLTELERRAVANGYDRVFLTTGPRQPEARHLYLTAGYAPQFDVDADPETIGALAFTKDLPARPWPAATG